MRAAGIRELKSQLSKYLRLVRKGETVLVTDHGEVVAQLSPPPAHVGDRHESELEALARLAQNGDLRLATHPIVSAKAGPLARPEGAIDLQRALSEVRAER